MSILFYSIIINIILTIIIIGLIYLLFFKRRFLINKSNKEYIKFKKKEKKLQGLYEKKINIAEEAFKNAKNAKDFLAIISNSKL